MESEDIKKTLGYFNYEVLEEYYKELIKLCEEKTGLKFGRGFYVSIFPSDVEVVRLEQFIHRNNLFDTNVIYKKYREEIFPFIYKGE